MSTPKRIQRQRTKGWRMPEHAIYVGRPSRWGNPFLGNEHKTRSQAVENFRRALLAGQLRISVEQVRIELAGRDLACWCPLDQPCHADVLLQLANEDPA